ncbi:hypothetical protein Scep_029838 [Stephania cephalantha]|uniref:Reverse transcriptase zinc-binding domain-containing protein n=1 Tax=Stephania cephalantha TaxID=152367 RepID=A0AAP0HG03_9MAGN
MEQANVISRVLDMLCDASGHRISLGTYCGVPILHSRVSGSTYNHLVDNISKRTMQLKPSKMEIQLCSGKIDRWLLQKPLVEYANNEVPSHLLDLKVKNFITSGRQWNRELFQQFLPEDGIMEIAAIKVSQPEDELDIILWCLSKTGDFTVMSAYNYLMERLNDPNGKTWKLIWSWKRPERIKMFLWLTANGRLQTNVGRVKRNLVDSDQCQLYNRGSESQIHVLRDCEGAAATWQSLIPGEYLNRFFTTDFHTWLLSNLDDRNCRVKGPTLMWHYRY